MTRCKRPNETSFEHDGTGGERCNGSDSKRCSVPSGTSYNGLNQGDETCPPRYRSARPIYKFESRTDQKTKHRDRFEESVMEC